MKLKSIFILIFLLFTYIFISAHQYVSTISNNLSENIFRLHVIANSNSPQDQELKYKVRDNLINYMNSLCYDSLSKEDVINTVNSHIDDFTAIAVSTINENGFDYNAKIEVGNFKFPSKSYGNISFPAGYYDALDVKIGNAMRSKLVVCALPITLLFRFK